MKVYEKWGGIALIAGVLCYFFAFFLIVMAPAWVTDAQDPYVTDVVTGERVPVPEYTEAEAAGRQVYIEQVCWHCHSQFVRPVNDEDLRWGPVSQAGEAMVDTPHLYGTRRIGPDLAREGGRRPDEWHYAHFYDPRYTVPQSVMPGFPWLFREYAHADAIRDLIARCDTDGDGIVSAFDDKTAWSEEDATAMKSEALDPGGVEMPDAKHGDTPDSLTNHPDTWTVSDKGDGLVSDYDARPRPTAEGQQVVAYIQRLGTAIGKWRKPIVLGTPVRGDLPPMVGVDEVPVGSWPAWNGNEPALDDAGKQDTDEVVAYVPDGQMPLRDKDARLYGAARDKATKEQLANAEIAEASYKAAMAAWRQVNPQWAQRLDRGKELYQRYCTGCHGETGRGNGAGAQFMLVRPRDFTLAKYRYRSTQAGNRPLDGDLFRSIYRGLPGTAMPTFKDLTHEQIWHLVDYIKSFDETQGGEYGKPYNDESLRIALPPMPPMVEGQEDELFLRGKAIYASMKCINCHGAYGRGDGPGWNTTRKDNGGLMRPRDFPPRTGDPRDQPNLRMRGGATPRDLYRTIMTGLDGTGMPPALGDFQGKWASADLVARLKKDGASAEDLAAAQKSGRMKLFMNLGEELPGVTVVEEDGTKSEYLGDLRRTVIAPVGGVFGDDWALVWYVYRLMHGADAQWPLTVAEDE